MEIFGSWRLHDMINATAVPNAVRLQTLRISSRPPAATVTIARMLAKASVIYIYIYRHYTSIGIYLYIYIHIYIYITLYIYTLHDNDCVFTTTVTCSTRSSSAVEPLLQDLTAAINRLLGHTGQTAAHVRPGSGLEGIPSPALTIQGGMHNTHSRHW